MKVVGAEPATKRVDGTHPVVGGEDGGELRYDMYSQQNRKVRSAFLYLMSSCDWLHEIIN